MQMPGLQFLLLDLGHGKFEAILSSRSKVIYEKNLWVDVTGSIVGKQFLTRAVLLFSPSEHLELVGRHAAAVEFVHIADGQSRKPDPVDRIVGVVNAQQGGRVVVRAGHAEDEVAGGSHCAQQDDYPVKPGDGSGQNK